MHYVRLKKQITTLNTDILKREIRMCLTNLFKACIMPTSAAGTAGTPAPSRLRGRCPTLTTTAPIPQRVPPIPSAAHPPRGHPAASTRALPAPSPPPPAGPLPSGARAAGRAGSGDAAAPPRRAAPARSRRTPTWQPPPQRLTGTAAAIPQRGSRAGRHLLLLLLLPPRLLGAAGPAPGRGGGRHLTPGAGRRFSRGGGGRRAAAPRWVSPRAPPHGGGGLR